MRSQMMLYFPTFNRAKTFAMALPGQLDLLTLISLLAFRRDILTQ